MCNTTTQHQKDTILLVMSIMGLFSLICCAVTTKLVFCLRLHKFFIYRLALYQVVSSLFISIDDVMVITLSSYFSQFSEIYLPMCYITGYLLTYFIWMKLLFTTVLTFHLFSLAVCLRDFQKYEIHYVLFAVVLPITFTWIPFIGDNYGPAGGWCWIKDHQQDVNCSRNIEGIIEQYVLFYGPWYLCLIFGVIAALVVTGVLIYRICCKPVNNTESLNESNEHDPLLRQDNQRHKKALLEAAPLLAYPAIFCLFNVFPITHRIHNAVSEHFSFELTVMHAFVNAAWGTLASIALVTHILIAKCIKRKKQQVYRDNDTLPTAYTREQHHLEMNTSCTKTSTLQPNETMESLN